MGIFDTNPNNKSVTVNNATSAKEQNISTNGAVAVTISDDGGPIAAGKMFGAATPTNKAPSLNNTNNYRESNISSYGTSVIVPAYQDAQSSAQQAEYWAEQAQAYAENSASSAAGWDEAYSEASKAVTEALEASEAAQAAADDADQANLVAQQALADAQTAIDTANQATEDANYATSSAQSVVNQYMALQASAETVAYGTPATAEFDHTNNMLNFDIPAGMNGTIEDMGEAPEDPDPDLSNYVITVDPNGTITKTQINDFIQLVPQQGIRICGYWNVATNTITDNVYGSANTSITANVAPSVGDTEDSPIGIEYVVTTGGSFDIDGDGTMENFNVNDMIYWSGSAWEPIVQSVASVNGKTGAVQLTAADVDAGGLNDANTWMQPNAFRDEVKFRAKGSGTNAIVRFQDNAGLNSADIWVGGTLDTGGVLSLRKDYLNTDGTSLSGIPVTIDHTGSLNSSANIKGNTITAVNTTNSATNYALHAQSGSPTPLLVTRVTQNDNVSMAFSLPNGADGAVQKYLGMTADGELHWSDEQALAQGNQILDDSMITTSANDATAGRLLKVGDFGIGLERGSIKTIDFDTYAFAAGESITVNMTTSTTIPSGVATMNYAYITCIGVRDTVNDCSVILQNVSDASTTYILTRYTASNVTSWKVGKVADDAELDNYLKLSGGTMTGAVSWGGSPSYALARNTYGSLVDVHFPMTFGTNIWNDIGIIDNSKTAYGKVYIDLYGSGSHNNKGSGQFGKVRLDITCGETNDIPSMAVIFEDNPLNTWFITDAILIRDTGNADKWHVWVKSTGSVAGGMQQVRSTNVGLYVMNNTFPTSSTEPDTTIDNAPHDHYFIPYLDESHNLVVDGTVTSTGNFHAAADASFDGTVNLKGQTNFTGNAFFMNGSTTGASINPVTGMIVGKSLRATSIQTNSSQTMEFSNSGISSGNENDFYQDIHTTGSTYSSTTGITYDDDYNYRWQYAKANGGVSLTSGEGAGKANLVVDGALTVNGTSHFSNIADANTGYAGKVVTTHALAAPASGKGMWTKFLSMTDPGSNDSTIQIDVNLVGDYGGSAGNRYCKHTLFITGRSLKTNIANTADNLADLVASDYVLGDAVTVDDFQLGVVATGDSAVDVYIKQIAYQGETQMVVTAASNNYQTWHDTADSANRVDVEPTGIKYTSYNMINAKYKDANIEFHPNVNTYDATKKPYQLMSSTADNTLLGFYGADASSIGSLKATVATTDDMQLASVGSITLAPDYGKESDGQTRLILRDVMEEGTSTQGGLSLTSGVAGNNIVMYDDGHISVCATNPHNDGAGQIYFEPNSTPNKFSMVDSGMDLYLQFHNGTGTPITTSGDVSADFRHNYSSGDVSIEAYGVTGGSNNLALQSPNGNVELQAGNLVEMSGASVRVATAGTGLKLYDGDGDFWLHPFVEETGRGNVMDFASPLGPWLFTVYDNFMTDNSQAKAKLDVNGSISAANVQATLNIEAPNITVMENTIALHEATIAELREMIVTLKDQVKELQDMHAE